MGRDGTIAEFAGAVVLLAAFVATERAAATRSPPLSIFRIRGLAPANVTRLVGFAGLLADVLLPHALHAERARLLADRRPAPPTCRYCFACRDLGSGVGAKLLTKLGTRADDRAAAR